MRHVIHQLSRSEVLNAATPGVRTAWAKSPDACAPDRARCTRFCPPYAGVPTFWRPASGRTLLTRGRSARRVGKIALPQRSGYDQTGGDFAHADDTGSQHRVGKIAGSLRASPCAVHAILPTLRRGSNVLEAGQRTHSFDARPERAHVGWAKSPCLSGAGMTKPAAILPTRTTPRGPTAWAKSPDACASDLARCTRFCPPYANVRMGNSARRDWAAGGTEPVGWAKSPGLGGADMTEPAAILPTRTTPRVGTAWAKSPEASAPDFAPCRRFCPPYAGSQRFGGRPADALFRRAVGCGRLSGVER